MADITQCYESIPLSGVDNLLDALQFLIKLAFNQHHRNHRKEQVIWVHINTSTGKVYSTKWSAKCPCTSYWIPLSMEWLLTLQQWLISSCFIRMEDMAWRQVTDIPMGFSCSPIWCNLYFATYEIQFMMCLEKLGLYCHMPSFSHMYRYTDDLCVLNNSDILKFLQPTMIHDQNCPFWIYPLPIVEIQKKLTQFENNQQDGDQLAISLMLLSLLQTSPQVYISPQNLINDVSSHFLFSNIFSLNQIDQSHNLKTQSFCMLYQYCTCVIVQVLCSRKQVLLVQTSQNNGFRRHRLMQIVYRLCSTQIFSGIRFPLSELNCLFYPS